MDLEDPNTETDKLLADINRESSVETAEVLISPRKSRKYAKQDIQSVLIRETQGGEEWVRGVGIVRIEDPERDMLSSSPGSMEEDASLLTDSVYHLRRVLDDHRIIGFGSNISPG